VAECTCPRTDGYRIKRRSCLAHAEQDAAHWQEHDRRKFGTDVPHEPTDEFVVQAFAEGARSLWPDSRDPGWHVTFRRWLTARDERLLAAVKQACDTECKSPGKHTGCSSHEPYRVLRDAIYPPGQTGGDR